MKNYRGGTSRLRETVVAAAARTSGQAVIEEGFAGVAENTATINTRYTVRRDGEFEFTLAAAAKGDDVFISTTTFALTRAAAGTVAGAGTRLFGRVTAAPGNPNTGLASDPEPAAGKAWVSIGSGGSGA